MDLFEAHEQQKIELEALAQEANFEICDMNEYFENAVVFGKLQPVVGNYETRCTTFLSFVLGDQSVALRGESGTGKTQIMNAIVSLMWGDNAYSDGNVELFTVCEASGKGLVTFGIEDRINMSLRCFIPELQNVKMHMAMLKLWAEGKPYRYQRQDKRGNTEDITLEPRAVLTSLAEGNEVMKGLGSEMQRRYVNLWTTNSKEQNEEIQRRKAMARLFPKEKLMTMTDDKIALFAAHARNVMKLNLTMVVNPGIMEIRKGIPSKYVVSNSYTDYFFDIINAVTRFYYYRNIIDDNSTMFSTPHDNKIAWILAGPQMIDACLSLPYGIGRTILDVLPKRTTFGGEDGIRADSEDLGYEIQQVADILDTKGMAIERGALEEIMKKLVFSNYAKEDGRTKRFFKTIEDTYDSPDIDWHELVKKSKGFMEENYSGLSDTYISEYCEGEGLTYIHPFTGARMEILSDGKVCDEEYDTMLDNLEEKVDLPRKVIEDGVDFYRLKDSPHGPTPKLFFVNEMLARHGLVSKKELVKLYDELKVD